VPNEPVGPQTRSQLAEHLDAIGVRPGTYHRDGAHLDDAFTIDQKGVSSLLERSPATRLGPRSACERGPYSWD